MYKIAVCDNDGTELGIIERCVKRYLAERPNINGTIKTFLYSYDLKKEIDSRNLYDLYLLDILMPEVDGMALGRLIRQKTSTAPIIYITSTKDFAYEAYGIYALQYLSKPLDEKELFAVLDTAYELYRNRPRHLLTLKSTDGIFPVAQEDIMYIENEVRKATYTLFDETTIVCNRLTGSFENFVSPLNVSEKFIQPHKSYFVNMKYIKVFNSDMIIMDDGKTIPVNQKKMTRVRDAYLDYLTKLEED